MKIEVFNEKATNLFSNFGLTSDFWGLNLDTLKSTWVAMIILFTLVIIARIFLRKNLNPVALIFQKLVDFFDNLCRESFGTYFEYRYLYFVSTIFFFTLFGCLVGLIPFLEETPKDINTAFAIGSLSFFYVQYQKIRLHGFWEFLKELAHPFILLLPLNIIGELSKIASMSFRLFGNILGGAIIFLIAINALENYKVYFMIFSFVSLILYFISQKFINLKKYKALNFILKILVVFMFFFAGIQMFFGIFEGVVQSFVLTMLTTTYLAVAVHGQGEPHEKEETKRRAL